MDSSNRSSMLLKMALANFKGELRGDARKEKNSNEPNKPEDGEYSANLNMYTLANLNKYANNYSENITYCIEPPEATQEVNITEAEKETSPPPTQLNESISSSVDGSLTSELDPDTASTYTVTCNVDYPTRLRLKKLKSKSYCVSPNSDDVDEFADDSDRDPNYTDNYSDHKQSPNYSHDSSSSSDETQADTTNAHGKKEEAKGKKRTCNMASWEVKRTKLLRNSGKAYVSCSKTKKTFEARRLRPPYGDKCRIGCSKKIDGATREEIFSSYWALADLQRQREFIIRHITSIKPKYRYSSTQELRRLNSAFYFEIDQKRIRVCKTFFKATLDITDRPIRTALDKKNESGFVDIDLRGKHGNHHTVDPEIKDSIREFIRSIPRIESHYLRAQTSREYIEGGKSLADLYRDYKEIRETQNLPFANQVMFSRIFNTEFNISFYIPKKDQCDLCTSFHNADDDQRKTLLDDYKTHQDEKILSRKEKESDKEKPYTAVYDLQAVMPLPKGLASSFYYKSKINCYNFTVSDLKAKRAECFFWTEMDGNRGASEIGSCILRYIELMVREAERKEDMDIIFFSDKCCGQQKNKYLLSLYCYAMKKYNIRSITHKFLITGHSQNEGDNIHSVIEKQVKRHLRSAPIYVPDQYITLITTAKKTGRPYRVHRLSYEDFYDLKALQEAWGNNFNTDVDKNKLKWHDVKVLKVKRENPESFFYKTSYNDKEFKQVIVQKSRSSRTWETVSLAKAFTRRLPLCDIKKKGIKDLIDRNIIKKTYYNSFYKDVLDE